MGTLTARSRGNEEGDISFSRAGNEPFSDMLGKWPFVCLIWSSENGFVGKALGSEKTLDARAIFSGPSQIGGDALDIEGALEPLPPLKEDRPRSDLKD